MENISIKRCPFCSEEIIAETVKCKHCGGRLNKPTVITSETSSTVHQYSNTQAPWRLVLLSVLTSGIYDFYWFYRNWKHLKIHKKLNIRPVWRTVGLFVPIYGVFLGYWQFKNIRDYAEHAGCPTFSSPGWLIIGYVFLSNISVEMNLYSTELIEPSELLGYTILAIFLGLYAVWILTTVQKTLNAYWETEQPKLKIRTNFSRGELILLFFSGSIWILSHIRPFITE